jgi:peptidoglycan/xylan/chitin deacetylase (PgdA/CDA1 family)
MGIPAIARLRLAGRSVTNWLTPKVLILVYHRVVELSSDPYLLGVTPQHFAEHLEVLRRHGRAMRLQQLTQALQDGTLPRRAVVVTFDDGYADNLYNAKPLLERYNIPATVFVTTGQIGREREFWWDELERVLLQPGTLPDRLRLTIHGSSWEWDLSETVTYSDDDYRDHGSWNIGQDGPTARHHLYRALYQRLVVLSDSDRWTVLDDLLSWAGREPLPRPSHRVLSGKELVRLSEGELVEIGAHTVTHPVLSQLPPSAQRDEIGRSKAYLERLLSATVTSFAYPYGAYTTCTPAIVRAAGFESACAALSSTVRQGSDRFQLPRLLARDWSGEAFDGQLGAFFQR